MNTTIIWDPKHFQAAVDKAREPGTTPSEYVQFLVDAATTTFDELLAPVRERFRQSGVSEEELDQAVTAARKALHDQERSQRQE